jgi:hypothetical protein
VDYFQPVIPGTSGGTIQERFEEFHRLNPWVYQALVALAKEMAGEGHRKIGIRMLYEVVRWKYLTSTTDPSSEFKLNDHYHSRYVRLIVERNPELSEFFETRKLRAA